VPTTEHGGVSLYYETAGSGAPVVFVGDAGYGAWQWAWQHGAVAGRFEAVTFDHRGCGRSSDPSPDTYAVSELARDLVAVVSAAGAVRPHLVGAGLGGMVALAAALDDLRPRTLTLVGTAATGADVSLDPLYGPPSDPGAVAAATRAGLSEGFCETHPDVLDRIVAWRCEEDASPAAWRAQAAAVRSFDVADRLVEVTTPAVVAHGTGDDAWPPAAGEALARDLPRGRYVPLEGAGHLAWVEQSAVVSDLLVGLLEDES
jgi:pimeloyl-ACP methyl ester carboxylesterase